VRRELVRKVRELAGSPVGERVERRAAGFREVGRAGEGRWFSELCFCLLTANFTAEGGVRIQKAELAARLKALGHRFPNARARYMVEARGVIGHLKDTVTGFGSGPEAREWLLGVKGLGLKEASHFLRNVGFTDVAIIDRHILRLVFEHCLFGECRLNRDNYMAIERELAGLAAELGMDLARLDLYLWYLKTGSVLK
jgi:N-glycosylase/DNA lyase